MLLNCFSPLSSANWWGILVYLVVCVCALFVVDSLKYIWKSQRHLYLKIVGNSLPFPSCLRSVWQVALVQTMKVWNSPFTLNGNTTCRPYEPRGLALTYLTRSHPVNKVQCYKAVLLRLATICWKRLIGMRKTRTVLVLKEFLNNLDIRLNLQLIITIES